MDEKNPYRPPAGGSSVPESPPRKKLDTTEKWTIAMVILLCFPSAIVTLGVLVYLMLQTIGT